jgi:hypothetical protein
MCRARIRTKPPAFCSLKKDRRARLEHDGPQA